MAEMPAFIINYFTLEHYGRRMAIASFMSVGGIFCIASRLMPGTMKTVLSLLAVLCIDGAYKVDLKIHLKLIQFNRLIQDVPRILLSL